MSRPTDETNAHRALSRRQFLRALSLGSGAALLAACGATPAAIAPTSAPAPAAPTVAPAAPTSAPAVTSSSVLLTMMGRRSEFNEDLQQTFETANSGVTIEFIEFDQARLFAMATAGNTPDLIRVQAPDVPQLLSRNLLLDLTPYFQASSVLKLADLAPANNAYKAESPLKVGSGAIYGMVKDWSPDLSLFAYKAAFEEAGVALPATDTPITYAELAELATKLTKIDGDRIARWGYGFDDARTDRIWMSILAEQGQSLYSDDFTTMNLVGNDTARAVVQYFYDLAQARATPTPINPSPTWPGEDFTKGTVGLAQYGFWFSAMAESDITKDQVVMLPAPTWSGGRINPTITGTGLVVSAQSKNPDAAWKLFEWYMGGEPSVDRAKSGWGVPALVSQYVLLPTESPFQQQVGAVLTSELPYAEQPLQFNPYLGGSAVNNIWKAQLEQALRGSLSFDEMLAAIERETNVAIQDGLDRTS